PARRRPAGARHPGPAGGRGRGAHDRVGHVGPHRPRARGRGAHPCRGRAHAAHGGGERGPRSDQGPPLTAGPEAWAPTGAQASGVRMPLLRAAAVDVHSRVRSSPYCPPAADGPTVRTPRREEGCAMTTTAGTTYDIEGRLLEVCTCKAVCPCWVGEDPDGGTC